VSVRRKPEIGVGILSGRRGITIADVGDEHERLGVGMSKTGGT
jgi:hypothetical protein